MAECVRMDEKVRACNRDADTSSKGMRGRSPAVRSPSDSLDDIRRRRLMLRFKHCDKNWREVRHPI
jgi:hypothetical protein